MNIENLNIPDNLPWLGEKFTPGMAWIDLQILGENRPSERVLANRWKWSRDRVRRFLAKLGDLVLQDQSQDHNQYQQQDKPQYQKDILESVSYKDSDTNNKTTTNTISKTTRNTTKEIPLNSPSPIPTLPFPPEPPITHTPVTTPPIIPQEANERAREREKSLSEREELFRAEVFAFSDKWQESMLEEFFNYWSECSPGAKKMRFEKEKSWDLSKRLYRWDKNNTDRGRNSMRITERDKPRVIKRPSPEEIALNAARNHEPIANNVRQAINIIWNGTIPKERIDAALIAAGYQI